MRDTGGTADQDDFMDVQLEAKEDINRVKSTPEEILVEFFKTVTSEGSVEVITLKESRWMFG